MFLALAMLVVAQPAAVSMFNGKDLSGWESVNCAPGTFFVKGDEVVTTGRPTGYLRTAKQYENFVLEFEWLHTNVKDVGNSGFFVWGDPLPAVGVGYTRGIEVQVLVNYETDWATSHGDLFSIWGAKCTPDRPHPKGYERCLPSERRCKGGGEWNHYKVIAQDGAIKLHVNGKEVSGVHHCNPRKGYLALESEGAECHFRKMMIQEMPSTNPKPEECAKEDEGHKSLFTGLDLSGLEADKAAWKVSDGVLRVAGTTPLTTAKPMPKGELLFDWKLPGKEPTSYAVGGTKLAGKGGKWERAVVKFDGGAAVSLPAEKGLEVRSLFFKEAK